LKIAAGDTVYCDQKNLCILELGNRTRHFNVEQFVIIEKPNTSWTEVGGLTQQITEIKEVIELPLKNPKIFQRVGIKPPKGVLLYGPPGTGKTLLAKAVAASTKSTFIEIVGSELVMKFIGEGAKLVKEIFQLARERAPSIVFIDELDSIAATRIETGTSGEREVQRTFMQFLAEIDGFNNLDNVKIIGCTNRLDILDPAIIRPGRLDRLIKVDLPNSDGIKEIFKIHTKSMNLTKEINMKKVIAAMDGFSGAEVHAVATEAGYFAIREKRDKILELDIIRAIEKVKRSEEDGEYQKMFG
jgi:proteasome regulatory subunit